ncbi:PH domain-containing protein [Candidatus Clostridium radicumherbarum]|uniref:PH domain-containing protein n=1 Tax=Candidatus Clostridium radicumherbarum TaxID=3381662 RepID=A0ABW8TS87_9CLOT
MEIYKPCKGKGIYYILGLLLIYVLFFTAGLFLVNTYILFSLLKIAFVVITAYLLYYILQYTTLKYGTDEKNIYIINFIKTIKIPYEEIDYYKVEEGNINGVKLSGISNNNFALGKSVIKKIGTTNMYVTSNKNIIYLKVNEKNYAITPMDFKNFKAVLEKNNEVESDWTRDEEKHISLHKDRGFMVPLILSSIIIFVLTLNPFILYLTNKLPSSMPLNFDSSFLPVDKGTGKQFAFNQMIYGVLNMAILFCMYYASHFYAKYDKKSAKKYMYISLLIAAAFLIIQIRILLTFR